MSDTTTFFEAVYLDFVPKALQNGSLKPKPDPLVVGKGLEKVEDVQTLLDFLEPLADDERVRLWLERAVLKRFRDKVA
jgi:hypothetical protein